MNVQQYIKQLKQRLMQKLDIKDCFAEDRLFFMQHSKDKILVGVEQFNCASQDKYFFLFDSTEILNSKDDCYGPVAMIKFMPNQKNKNDMFIRRLEFINDSCRGKGYASCMMKLFESYCSKNKYNAISGEFLPLHNVTEEVVENYYKRNGFKITKQGEQKMIYKVVKQPVQTMVSGVTLVKNDYLQAQKNMQKDNNLEIEM